MLKYEIGTYIKTVSFLESMESGLEVEPYLLPIYIIPNFLH
jgi:hypothetical protein